MLQDLGRFGFRKFGVPSGGAFDQESLFIANTLLRNPLNAPALEIPLMGGDFTCLEEVSAAIVGAACRVTVNGRSQPAQCRLQLKVGDRLTLGPTTFGVRTYLALKGGIESETTLESVSGNRVGRHELLVARNTASLESARLAEAPASLKGGPFRFLAGPQARSFDLQAFESAGFIVSPHSDRRGLRLIGVCPGTLEENPSEPASFGSIQVTPSGEPIVLGPDGPTIGGYPKIGVVISADLDRLGQLAPGAELQFRQVNFDGAVNLWDERNARLEQLLQELQVLDP